MEIDKPLKCLASGFGSMAKRFGHTLPLFIQNFEIQALIERNATLAVLFYEGADSESLTQQNAAGEMVMSKIFQSSILILSRENSLLPLELADIFQTTIGGDYWQNFLTQKAKALSLVPTPVVMEAESIRQDDFILPDNSFLYTAELNFSWRHRIPRKPGDLPCVSGIEDLPEVTLKFKEGSRETAAKVDFEDREEAE